MTVAVVILNWNGKDLLKQFLPSVIAHSQSATIYVADNASTDDSVAFVTENFPEVKIIQNRENSGYAGGYNQALSHCTEDIFVLLNSDIEVTENWLTPIISAFENDALLVAAQPKILDYKNKDLFEYAGSAGGFIDSLGYPFCRGRIFDTIERDNGQYNDERTIFWASGACLFVKRKAFLEAKGFDEDFFAHQEEIDLCWRMQANGGKIKYFGTSKVYHVGGATLQIQNPKKTFLNFRNTLLLLVKNDKSWLVSLKIVLRMILDGLAAFKFLLSGQFNHLSAIFNAHVSFYSLLPKFLKKRRLHASNFQFYHTQSIVFQYFILQKKHFNDL